MTQAEQLELAWQVDPEIWGRLCADDRFRHALATDDTDYAQVVMEILTSDWTNFSRTIMPTL